MTECHIPELLFRSQITQGLDIAALNLLLDYFERETVEAGQIIVHEGRPANTVYVILSGKVDVKLLRDTGSPETGRFGTVHLATLGAGEIFGEYAVIDGQPASASVIALERVVLLGMTKTDFLKVIAIDRRIEKIIYCNLLHILVRRLRQKDRELDLVTVHQDYAHLVM